MKPIIHLVRLRKVNILQQLHMEELLLRKTEKNFCIMNSGQESKSIVVGFSGKIPELIDVAAVQTENIPVIRRYTGGGTVIVDDGCMFISFLMNDKDVHCKPYPREIMAWTADAIYSPVFTGIGLANTFALTENDYTALDRKIAGNAQTITKSRWVHHTSFLWSFEPSNMRFLQIPKKRPAYRIDRDHQAFLTTLSDIGVPSLEAFNNGVVARLHDLFEIKELSEEELNAELESAMTKVTKIEEVRRTFVETSYHQS